MLLAVVVVVAMTTLPLFFASQFELAVAVVVVFEYPQQQLPDRL